MAARDFSYKPALLRGAQDWQLDGPLLHAPDRRMDLRDVSRAAWVAREIKTTRFDRLDLWDNDGMLSISITTHIMQPADDDDRRAHHALCRAVAGVLADVQPQLPVVIGEYGRAKLAMFIVGVFTLLMAAGLVIAALATGVSTDRLAGMAMPVVLLLVMGGVFSWNNRPWVPPRVIPAAALPAVLLSL